MNAKELKYQRKLFRKEARKEAREMGRLLMNKIKPRPKWIPEKVWMLGMRIFINI